MKANIEYAGAVHAPAVARETLSGGNRGKKWHRSLCIAVLFGALTGCGNGEIFKTFSLDDGSSISTGARQRVISNVKPGIASRPGRVDPSRIICVEPSPDVAVAVANSLGASAGVAGKGSFSISGASAEGLAQLAERTTAIQAILKQGYNACVDYMNGAITGTTYSMRQSRLDDLLVTLLLSENASGAFGRSGASIGTNANATSRAAASILPAVGQNLQQANADLAEKQTAVSEKQTALNEAQAALDADPDNATLKQTRDTRKAELDVAIAARDAALRNVTGLTEAASTAAAGVTSVTGQGGLTASPNAAVANVLGQMQERFLNKNTEQAYIATCLTELGLWKIRDPEDNRVREVTVKSIEKDGELTQHNAKPFYLAHQIGLETRLTRHCEKHLDGFLLRAQTNDYNKAIKALEIKAKSLDVEQLRFAAASTEGGFGIHPLATYNLAKEAADDLTDKAAALTGKPVPNASDNFSETAKAKLEQRRADALAAAAEVQGKPDAQTKGSVDAIELAYTTLIADTRRQGTETEREQWRKDLVAQQKEADAASSKLENLTERIESAAAEIDAVLRLIETVTAQQGQDS